MILREATKFEARLLKSKNVSPGHVSVPFQVWDGTRCPHTLLKVIVEPSVTEGPPSFSAERETLIANVLVYDNHVEAARQLKVRGHCIQRDTTAIMIT